jgi:hypothetical protein
LYDSLKSEWKVSHSRAIELYLENPDYKYLTEKELYENNSGAWKIVNSLKLEEYITIKELIFESLTLLK